MVGSQALCLFFTLWALVCGTAAFDMPTVFTDAQLAASAAAGAPHAKESFADDGAWHAYQDSWHDTFICGQAQLPPVGHATKVRRSPVYIPFELCLARCYGYFLATNFLRWNSVYHRSAA